MKYTHIVPLANMILATAALAGSVPPDYGFNWATIGDAGNRATRLDEMYDPFGIATNPHVGAVDYEFRMATTEVTVGQYFEFAQVYHPFYTQNTGNVLGLSDFTGGDIRLAWGEISIRQGRSPNQPIDMGWEYAARYVNWLHNGKVNAEWAFETGVYDTSTFTQNPDGTYNHQAAHNPDAKFWLPTRDEWTKAGFWDPEKNNGEGGYWMFPNGSDTRSLSEIEKNAGFGDEFPMDVGSFSDVMSPWGILDMAGGVQEWSESETGGRPFERYLFGSGDGYTSPDDPFTQENIGDTSSSVVFFPDGGIRLVSVIPSPGPMVVFGVSIIFISRRRK